MEFRVDFYFRFVMDVIYYAVNILLFKVLYLHTGIIGGWDESQMMVFISCYLLADAFNMTVFSNNLWWLPVSVNRGDLDYYLIRPVSPLFFLSLREFSANSFLNLIIAVAFFIYTLMTYPGTFHLLSLLGLLILLLNGFLIYYCIQMITIIPVFWTHSGKGFMDLFYTLGLAMERPDKIFRGWLRILFTIFIPFALVASFPARFFIEGLDTPGLVHLILVSGGIWTIMIFFWKKGLKNYSSASS